MAFFALLSRNLFKYFQIFYIYFTHSFSTLVSVKEKNENPGGLHGEPDSKYGIDIWCGIWEIFRLPDRGFLFLMG